MLGFFPHLRDFCIICWTTSHIIYMYIHSGVGWREAKNHCTHWAWMRRPLSGPFLLEKKYSIFLSFFPHTRYECPHYFGIGYHTWIMAMIILICIIWLYMIFFALHNENGRRYYMKIHWLKWIWEKANGIIICTMHEICIENTNIKSYGFYIIWVFG